MTLTSKKIFKKIIIIYDNLCAKVYGVTGQNLGWETHQNIYKIVDGFINNVYLQSRQNIYTYSDQIVPLGYSCKCHKKKPVGAGECCGYCPSCGDGCAPWSLQSRSCWGRSGSVRSCSRGKCARRNCLHSVRPQRARFRSGPLSGRSFRASPS